MRFSFLFVSVIVSYSKMCSAQALQVLASACMAAAEVIVVTVGGNGSTIFVPQRVVAALGDVVMFNCKFFSCP